MAPARKTLVGRAAELGVLDEALATVAAGEQGAVLLAGPPGIGKTRLLAELATRADGQGCVVLSGSASELEVDLPFWVFVDALDEYVAGLEPRRIDALEPSVRAELARVFPSLADLAVAHEPAIRDERYRAHRAVRELLERLAATKPVVLVLDDLHWADEASVELVAALLRAPPAAAVLLVAAARPRQLPGRLASALDRAARTGAVRRLELGSLEREDARLLLGADVDPAEADRLFTESGGNPFYLEQLARAPRGRGGAATDGEVPAGVVAAMAEELARLPDPTRSFLAGAAVAGDPFELDLGAEAAAVESADAMAAVDELLRLELIRATDVPRRFRFRHPLVRRAVYDAAPAGWRLAAHERCAAALATRGAAPAALAHHVEHAARPGDAAALETLRQAGESVATRAPASAARWFGAALRLLPDTVAPAERVALLLARAEAHTATGRLEESRADLLECIALDDGPLRVRLTVACAGTEHMLGDYDAAYGRIARALPEAEGAQAVLLELVLAFDGMFRGDYATMRARSVRAVERAEGDDAMALAVLALASAFTGDEGERARATAAELVDAMTDDEVAVHLDATAHLASAELHLNRYAEAEAHAARAIAVGRTTGRLFPTLIPVLGGVLTVRGRLNEAIDTLEGGVEAARLSGNMQDVSWRLHFLSLAAHGIGDLKGAVAAGEEAVERAAALGEGMISVSAGLALAVALQAAGKPQRAKDVLLRHAHGEELPLLPVSRRAHGFAVLAACCVELGQVEEAARAAERAAGLPGGTMWADRAAAGLAAARGEHEIAAERALASAGAADRAGAVVEAAFSREVAGRALAAAGDADAAGDELEHARATFAACGATRRRDAAERELRRLGHHIYRRTRTGSADAAELSARELQVAELVVERMTNAEIAAELFLSIKTVETHLRNMFAKLGVSSRVELARAVQRRAD